MRDVTMDKYNIMMAICFITCINFGFSQKTSQEGKLNITTTKVLSYTDENGTKFPYTVTTEENRVYTASFIENTENPENFDRNSVPAVVSKKITIVSEADSHINETIVLNYKKQLADNFEVNPTNNGFTIEVAGKVMNYIIGEGVSYPNLEDKNFFTVEESD